MPIQFFELEKGKIEIFVGAILEVVTAEGSRWFKKQYLTWDCFVLQFSLIFSLSKKVILTARNIGHCFNIRHFSYPDPNSRELWCNGVSSGL